MRTQIPVTFGIIVDNIVSPFTPLIIRGMLDHLKGFHYFSVIINVDWDPQAESEAIHELA